MNARRDWLARAGRLTLGLGAIPALPPVFPALLRVASLAPPAAMSLGLTGCDKQGGPDFQNLDVTGDRAFDPQFLAGMSIPDSQGKQRTLADWRGRVIVLFFGYAQCPDICPTSLANLARARRQLGADGDRLQVVFVTVDPERDTPAILDQYMQAFDPSFVALRPVDDAAVARLAKQFHLVVEKVPEDKAKGGSGGDANPAAGTSAATANYSVAHTAASFLFDAGGVLRLYAKDDESVDTWVHDIRLLLANPAAAKRA